MACILGLDSRWLSPPALAMSEAWSCCRCRGPRRGLQATLTGCRVLGKAPQALCVWLHQDASADVALWVDGSHRPI